MHGLRGSLWRNAASKHLRSLVMCNAMAVSWAFRGTLFRSTHRMPLRALHFPCARAAPLVSIDSTVVTSEEEERWPPVETVAQVTASFDNAAPAADAPLRLIAMEGFVRKRRAFGKSLVFLDLMDMADGGDESQRPMMQALLKAPYFAYGDATEQQLRVKTCAPGARLEVLGTAQLQPSSERPMIQARAVRLLTAAPSGHSIGAVIAAAAAGTLGADEAAAALGLPSGDDDGEAEAGGARRFADLAIAPTLERLWRAATPAVRAAAEGSAPKMLDVAEAECEVVVDRAALDRALALAEGAGGEPAARALLDAAENSAAGCVATLGDASAAADREGGGWVTVAGFVHGRRRFQAGEASVDLCDEAAGSAATKGGSRRVPAERRLRLLLHPEVGSSDLALYRELAAPGSRVRIVGRWSQPPAAERAGRPCLLVWAARLERASGVLKSVRHVVDSIGDGRLDAAEGVAALGLPAEVGRESVWS